MTKHTVLICDPIDLSNLQLGEDYLVDYNPKITREELIRKIPDYEVVIVRSRTKIDANVIEAAKKLRIIARPGTGLDNIDLSAASAKGIEVINSPESLVEAVAEHVFALMLALARNLIYADSTTKEGRWEKEKIMGVELKGKTIGIVGLGRIGRRVGEMAKVFGMNMIGYDVVEIEKEMLESINCKMVDLDSIFTSSDFITLHVPLSPETRNLVNSRRLSMMKRSAYLINASRGSVIDEKALIEALRNSTIAGAALDVFEKEPPTQDLLSAPNLIATPHIGGQTAEAQKTAISLTASKIIQHFQR
jgi:D-3-phosphoglycerate dehydrogenase